MKLNIGNDNYIVEESTQVTLKVENEVNTYKVLEAEGALKEEGYVVLNNIYVNPEHTKEFENRFLNRTTHLQETDGFQALRVLRPESSSRYVILTLWESITAFKSWQDSQQYKQTHSKRGTSQGIDKNIVDRSKSFNKGYEVIQTI